MALALKDRVKETTIVVGTGAATLLGSSIGFQPFSVVGDGNTTYYGISDQFGSNWEVGIGTYSSSGNTLARTTVLASSNAGALVVFTAGVKDVFVTYPSEKGVWYDASGNVLFTGTTTAANLAYTGTLTGSTGILNIGSGQLYKDASGNVGIGTSSPSTYGKLAVVGGNFYTSQAASPSGWAATTNANSNAGSYYFQLYTAGGNNVGQHSCNSSGEYLISTYSTTALLLGTNSTERMRIDSAGNLGIGTSSPTSKLDIGSGNLNFSGTSQRITGDMSNATITNRLAFQTSTANANTSFTILPNGTSVVSSIVLEGDSAQTNGSFFSVATGTASNTEARITSGIRGTGTYLPITFYTGGSEKLRLDTSGNLGIGTISPNASAILDAQSTTKGVRFPNMTTTQKTAISSPAAGLVVFDTTLAKLCVYSGAAWQTITSI